MNTIFLTWFAGTFACVVVMCRFLMLNDEVFLDGRAVRFCDVSRWQFVVFLLVLVQVVFVSNLVVHFL